MVEASLVYNNKKYIAVVKADVPVLSRWLICVLHGCNLKYFVKF